MPTEKEALSYHEKLCGKLNVRPKKPITSREDLSLTYTPGVAAPSRAIADDMEKVWTYTMRGNAVAIVSDGSAVLGLGNVGPHAALPVMEGKSVIMAEMAAIDAIPLCIDAIDADAIVQCVKAVAPTFGGINLEDIAAPTCFEVEERLRDELDIPVFHDDQHGTAIVVLAALFNALKVKDMSLQNARIVLNGAGAAGIAIANLLLAQGATHLVILDSKGIVAEGRADVNKAKRALAQITNPEGRTGDLNEAVRNADVFIGVSKAGLLTVDMVRTMAKDPIVFAMANPDPEIMPHDALEGGASIVATGRSDFPNQVNNMLVFPGIFRGALDARATDITQDMKIAAAMALANYVENPEHDNILPDSLDKNVTAVIAEAVKNAWNQ